MRNKSKVFDLSAISIIACDCLQAVICIFVDLFLVAQILKNPGASVNQNIISIGVFYVVYYLVLTSSYAVSGYALRKINKSFFVSIGAVVLTVVVFMVYILGDKVSSFVPLIALVYGVGFGFFSAGFKNLTAETISSKHQVKFFAVKRILFQVTYIIFPISLGLIIDKINFSFMALIMLVVCALLIMFSFFIKPKKSFKQSFNLIKFSKYLKQNKEQTKPLKLVYLSNFFRGASYDCFTTLITILVMKSFDSNTSLGMFQSIFTACSLVTMFFYLRYYRKKRATKFVVPTVVLVTCTVVGIMCATSQVTIICFYAVYAILNVILMSISDSRRAGVVRVLSLHSHILESNAFDEFCIGAGRITSSIFLILAGLFDSICGTKSLFLMIALGLVCGMYIMYGLSLIWVEKSLIKQDEEFKKVHSAEAIETTEE